MRDWKLLKKTSQLSLIYFCIFTIVIQLMVMFFPALYPGKDVLDRYRILHIGVATVILLFLLLVKVTRKSYWTKNLAAVLFLLLVLPVFPFIFFRNLWGSDQTYSLFEGSKLTLVILGVLVPVSCVMNALLVAGLVVEIFVLWYGFKIGASSLALDPDQPAIVVIYMMLGFGLLFFRMRYETLAQREADALARARFLEEQAKVFLELKDRANNPLQALHFSVALLEKTHPEIPRLREIQNSVDRLAEINSILNRYELKPYFEKK